MASSRHLEDIDEQFLQCPMCLDRLKEPKMLPCLHRYCRDCLHQIVKEENTKLCCPTCREEHDLPEDGVDGYKTDFNTKNIVEYIQLQESVEQEPLRVCAGCTKEQKVTGFCFKCDDFLCQGCHEYHMTIKILKDHRDHIFSLREAEARSLTIKKLSSLKEPPRCHKHPAKLSELCCTSCGNEPICLACTYGTHTGHKLQEVATLAEILREQLRGKLATAMEYKETLHKRKEEIANAKERLNQTVEEKQRNLQEEAKAEEDNIKREITELDERVKQCTKELKETREAKATARKQELERKIKQLEEEYERACEDDKQEADAQFGKLQEESGMEKRMLEDELDTIQKDIKEMVTSIKTQAEENTKKITDLSVRFNETVTKFENSVSTARNILAAEHEWTDVQCIPDICRAIEPLIESANKEYPELGVLSSITVGSLSSPLKKRTGVHITEKEESVVDIEGINYTGWPINTITSNKDGSIVITGRNPGTDNQADITVINIRGKRLRQSTMTSKECGSPWAYCAILSQTDVAFVLRPNEIGIYDSRDGRYRKERISEITDSWPAGHEVSCVATDSIKSHIIVGSFKSRNLFVFSDDFRHVHTLALPEMISWCRDITINGSNFLVCDYDSGKAYAVKAEGSASELVYEFTKPDIVGGDWRPCSGCTDKRKFIYILWVTLKPDRSLVVQYDKEGGQILTTRLLDPEYLAICMTVMETGLGEKLLIPTHSELIIYGLERYTGLKH